MQQIINQKFDSLREQLTTSYKQSQLVSTYKKENQLFKSSIIMSQENIEEEQEQSQIDQITLKSSFKSQKKKKQLVRVLNSQYDQKVNISTDAILQNVLIIQRNYKIHLLWRHFQKRVRMLRNRKFVVSELFHIEKKYNEDLRLIKEQFILKLREQHLITEEEILSLFLNVEQIYSLNQRFFQTIQQININYHHLMNISTEFRVLIPFFKIYYDYCSRFQLNNISNLRKSKSDFNQFIINIETSGILNGLTFESFLVKPVQQLPRYVLLLDKLIKYTEPTHQDLQGLKSIRDDFYLINHQINQMMCTYAFILILSAQSNLQLLAQFGTIDQQEIELIQKKKQEEEEFIKQLSLSVDSISYFKQKNGITNFIIYIIEIQFGNYRSRTYQRYSDLLKLQDQLNQDHYLSVSCFNFISELSLIAQRQIQIKSLLQSLFNHYKQFEEPLLQALDLPENLIFSKDQSGYQFTRDSVITQNRNTYNQEEEFEVVVNLSDSKNITLQIVKNCKCFDLIETLSRAIFLDKNFDFKLMIIQNGINRFLDDNEVVYKVIQNYENNTQSLFKKLINKAYNSFSTQNIPIFYLKKYLYLSQRIEIELYHQNKIRSQLLFYQELSQMHKLHLSYNDYISYTSLLFCIFYKDEAHKINNWNQIRTHQFQRFLPHSMYKLQTTNEWKKQIFSKIKLILQQMEEFMKQNDQIDDIRLLQVEFLNNIYQHPMHGIKLFSIKIIQNLINIQFPTKLILGVSYIGLIFYNLSMKLITEIKINEIKLSKLNNQYLTITLEQGILKIKSTKMFEVYRLLEEYQQINLLKLGQ